MDTRQAMSAMSSRSVTPRRVAVVVAALLLLGIGILVGRGLSPEASGPTPGASPKPGDSTDVPSAHSEPGAVEAATAFARIMTGPSGDDAAYRAGMEAIAAPQWKARAGVLANNAIEFVHDRYGEGGSISFHPAKYRVSSYSDERATVDLWGVVLASGPKVTGIEESWITGTIRMTWMESEWKVIGQSSRGGPTPELLRAEGGPSASTILQDFQEYESAPGQ